MRDKVDSPQINEIKRKKEGVELKVKSCFPHGAKLEEQLSKVDEEMQEVATANDIEEVAKELLDVAVAAIGGSEIAMRDSLHSKISVEDFLQHQLTSQYYRKQKEWKQEEKCGADPEAVE